MIFSRVSSVLFFLIFILSACNSNSKKETEITNLSNNLCKHSRWLKIFETKNQVIIQITNPDNPKQVFTYKTSGKATNQGTNSTKIIQLPSKKLAVLSATHIGMLSELNAINFISAISDVKFVYNQQVKKGVKTGKIISLGDEGQISIEKLLASKTKTMIYSAFSGELSQQKQFEKLGIISIPNYDWRETTPLGKADWLLLFGYLTGKQEQAKERIARLNTLYSLGIIEGKKIKNKEVFLLGNQMGDYWYAPAGESYQAILLKDAGINYLYANTKGTGSLALPMEQVIKDAEKATVWLNPGFGSKSEILKSNPKAVFLNVFQKGKIYCYSANMNNFWENSTVQPHWFLRDLQTIKSGKTSNDELYFYKSVE
jgi:iron complex transport system substrate-binding protein